MEIVESSFTGALKMILMVIGALVVIRFIGQLLQAKKNAAQEKERLDRQKAHQAEANHKRKNFGRTNILGKNASSRDAIEDAEYEVMD